MGDNQINQDVLAKAVAVELARINAEKERVEREAAERAEIERLQEQQKIQEILVQQDKALKCKKKVISSIVFMILPWVLGFIVAKLMFKDGMYESTDSFIYCMSLGLIFGTYAAILIGFIISGGFIGGGIVGFIVIILITSVLDRLPEEQLIKVVWGVLVSSTVLNFFRMVINSLKYTKKKKEIKLVN